jgi:uncharacterized membrane protein YebE (DUF533 family)
MINVDKLLGQILNSSQGKTLAGGLIVGGLAGALTGKTGKKVAGSALKLGGAAAIAGLAYKAYQTYKASQPQTQVPGGTPQRAPVGYAPSPQRPIGYDPNYQRQSPADRVEDIIDITPLRNAGYLPAPTDTAANEALSLKLIRAMIGAAKADGRIDAAESAKIFGQIDSLGLDQEEKSFLLTEISKPLSARDIAASSSSPEEAAELFAVSVMAVDPNGAAEHRYLSELAQLLRLEPGMAQAIRDGAAG